MNARNKVDLHTESQVIAMIARNDTHESIVRWLKEEKDIEVSLSAISKIKKRNQAALQYMKDQLVEHETTMATTILSKSRQLIDNRLDRALSLEKEVEDLQLSREKGEIDEKTFYQRLDVLFKNRLTVAELNSLSKEAFNQSQVEAGKPTSIAENPDQAKAMLQTLLTAIAKRDDEGAMKALFKNA